ncbi:MAG: tripartite tricarboxylate transporter TctB family protein [Paracoccaceae bacterium]
MPLVTRDRALGPAIVALGLLLALWGVPEGVDRPRNVRNIVLSPDFWPLILAWALTATGLGIALRAWLAPDAPEPSAPTTRAGLARLGVLAALLVALALGIATVGMVWASMGAFLVFLAIVRPAEPLAVLLVGIALPLALYAFFNHFAGVPVPQGTFVRLP